jgi:hypothetical protein
MDKTRSARGARRVRNNPRFNVVHDNQQLRFDGTMKDWVLSLTVVLADGTVIKVLIRRLREQSEYAAPDTIRLGMSLPNPTNKPCKGFPENDNYELRSN